MRILLTAPDGTGPGVHEYGYITAAARGFEGIGAAIAFNRLDGPEPAAAHNPFGFTAGYASTVINDNGVVPAITFAVTPAWTNPVIIMRHAQVNLDAGLSSRRDCEGHNSCGRCGEEKTFHDKAP